MSCSNTSVTHDTPPSPTHRRYVAYVTEYGHDHCHPSAGHSRRQGLDECAHLYGQLVVIVGADHQADDGDQFADHRQHHARLALTVSVAPRAHEHDEHSRYAALDERFPYHHVGHQLLDDRLFVLIAVPVVQRGTNVRVHPQVHPARLLQVQVLRAQRHQRAGHDVTPQYGLDGALIAHEPGLGRQAHCLPFRAVLVPSGRLACADDGSWTATGCRFRVVSGRDHGHRERMRQGLVRPICYGVEP